ncbi:RNA-directed DNA polymerase [Methylomarinovum caldicuralii]|uniref:RNA-directed DNA polymerase n=2 Tax=Methylomarinovum caldicuralii TaxID=438856 RepID=A0AAU9C5T0_9GAMM|nr:RNA-directed DNA polymerase [Methylomarinovum caldicuralii]
MAGTSSQENISTRQRKLVELARIEPKLELTTIAHHIDVVWLEEAWRRTRKDGAAGVDGVTASQYAAALEENLTRLLERFKTGRYRAPAVRRVHLPKPGTGKTRPIGIPTLEDKVLQRAVLMALEPIFEQDFLDCAYGFRPGRSAHQALERLWGGLMAMGGGWVIDLDIQNFFDDVDRDRLRNFLGQRVRDGVICRVIGKWLNAGVMEGGQLHYPEQGTPQGGVISPLLANLYLHHVLDLWFEQTVKPRLQGSAFEVRFADDAVLVFKREEDARRVLAVLGKRLAKYGLRLHPDKTRLLDFRKPGRKGQSFQYPGFTHYWGRSRERALGRQTQDRPSPAQPLPAGDQPLVPDAPPLAGCRPTSGPEPQTQGALCLLWDRRQQPIAGPLPVRGQTALVQMVVPPQPGTDELGPFWAAVQTIPTPPTARGSRNCPLRSDAIVRGAGCLNRARPDLWEPRVSNRPRSPGRSCQVPEDSGECGPWKDLIWT